MIDVSWDLAMAAATRLAPLREHYVETRRHKDVESQLNMVLAGREMALTQFKPDRKLGLLVVGATGAGKTTLLNRLLQSHPYLQRRAEGQLPVVSFRIVAPVTNKSLAHQTLGALGFEANFDARISSHKYWGWVRQHADRRGVVGFHFDEGQDLFLKASNNEAREALSMIKGLMEMPARPSFVILSGGPELERFIEMDAMVSERFYRAVLTPIAPDTAFKALVPEMALLAKKVGMTFGKDLDDIAKRVIHASFNQFGRSLEMTVDGIQEAAYANATRVTMEMFADAYHRHTHCGKVLNIFLAPEGEWRQLSPIKVSKPGAAAPQATPNPIYEAREDTIW